MDHAYVRIAFTAVRSVILVAIAMLAIFIVLPAALVGAGS
jgi:hypothetical protein